MRLGLRGREQGEAAGEAAAPDERALAAARRRFARRQLARRWLVWRRLLAVLLAVAAVCGAVWLVFFSATLAVHGVAVDGTSVLTARQVREAADVPLDVPLATTDLSAVEARVEALAPVASARATRWWPDRVRIDVTEREAVAVVERDGRVTGVDGEGVLFRDYPRRPAGLPVVHAGHDVDADALAEAAAVVAALPAPLALHVRSVDVSSADSIVLALRDDATVQWGSAQASATKADVLAALLTQHASAYDVSAPGRPTYVPR
jgi:cell division protein FtsQ